MNDLLKKENGSTRALLLACTLAVLAGLASVPLRALIGDWQETRALRMIEDRADGYARRMDISEETFGRYERSVQAMERAARAVPSSSRYPQMTADILMQLGIWTRTMEVLEHDRSGRLRPSTSYLEEARQRLITAVNLDPLQPDHHLALGHAYAEAGDHVRAEGEYQRAIEAWPVNSPLRYTVALELLIAGNREGALREARTLARNDDSYRVSESLTKQKMIELQTPEYRRVLLRSYLYFALEIIWRATDGSMEAVVMSVPEDPDARRVLEEFLSRRGRES